jgi:HlyD family secretion protein
MSATVDIMTKKAENVLSLPIAAVTTRDTSMRGKRIFGKGSEESEDMSDAKPADDSKKESETEKRDKTTEYVFAVRSSKAKLQAIKVGIQDTKYVEVKEGLKENEEVVTAPYSAISKILKDGDLVEVMKKEKLFTGGK